SETKKVFIRPLETKKLIAYNVDLDKAIRQVDIEIESISWQRLNLEEQEIISKKLFQIDNKKINIKNNTENREKTRNWVKFDVRNISPYNLVKSKFYTLVYLGQKLVAVNQIEENNFLTGEKRNLETSWFYRLSPYVNLQVEYETNPLDKENLFIITK
ncbi:hypothetical protein K8R66_03255, partial [bacterium]|nr:hypothetical protein [bacterium]